MSSSEGEDPDKFKGPGGLSGRQIFQAVQESVEKDSHQYGEDYAEPINRHQSEGAQQDGFVQKPVKIEPEKMSIKDLRELLMKHSIDYSDCFEKHDLVERVKLNMAKIYKKPEA